MVIMTNMGRNTDVKRIGGAFAAALLLVIWLLPGCGGEGQTAPDVSHIEPDLRIVRYEREMYEKLDSTQIARRASKLAEAYPEFTEIYASQVMREPEDKDSSNVAVLARTMASERLRMLYDTTMSVYADFNAPEDELRQMLRYYQHYFPNRPSPVVYTYISEIAYPAFTYGEGVLAVGLDYFLGDSFPYYGAFLPAYRYRACTPEHLVATATEALASEIIGEAPNSGRMLDDMVHNGKKLYILDKLLPHTPDSVKLQYTAAQTQWCVENEFEIWNFFMDQELIYSTNRRDFLKYVMPSPNSPGMPPESPGRTANWTGWRIVKKYMDKHPEKSLEDLIAIQDPQLILKGSGYKGNRKGK